MDEIASFKQQILALKKSGQTSATVNIDWLLNCLDKLSQPQPSQNEYVPTGRNDSLDGGAFTD